MCVLYGMPANERDLGGTGIEAWSSAEWRELAVAWLDRELGRLGMERCGDVEQPHLRPWGTVLKVATTRGPVWFKANGPSTAFEAGLYELLHRVTPARVLAPISLNVSRGWILLPHGGSLLADQFTGPDLADALVTVLPQYGELQLGLVPYAGELLALGVSDMRAQVMLQRFDEAVDAVREYAERSGAADQERYRRVRDFRGTFAEWCERLAGVPVSPSLDHNDLHPWNVFVSGERQNLQTRFYDWGDSVVAHPFSSMLVGMGFLQMRLKADVGDPRILRVRDAYLEVFGPFAPRDQLIDALELACRVGKVARALTWQRAVRTAGDGSEEFAEAPFESLASLLEDNYLGRV
jgi:hypothetical protein